MDKQIIWHRLPSESEEERIGRLNKALHRIFFDRRDVCPERFLDGNHPIEVTCRMCNAGTRHGYVPQHGTPRFLQSLDAMQLIVESGKFAEIREEFIHWRTSEGEPTHECRILLYGNANKVVVWYSTQSRSRQDAFYPTALKALGYTVVMEEQGEGQ